MPFDFTPVKAFLAAEIASIDALRAKLVQVLAFFPDSSDQLVPDPATISLVAPAVVTGVSSAVSIASDPSSAPPMDSAPDSSTSPSETTSSTS